MTSIIYRDQWGIPHLRADSAEELAHLQGANAARDRGWQIEVERWRSEGRLAEHVGPAEVGWDRFARRVRLDDTARRCYERLDDDTRRWLTSYVDGVNATLGETDAPEFVAAGVRPGPWHPWSPLGVFLVQHILFGTLGNKLWRAHSRATLGRDLIGAPEPDGSNAWASPHLIAGDPHRILELPGIYQQVRLSCPEFDVAGFAFPGVPGLPHFGHAGDVAWAVTNAMADYQDLYLEELVREGGRVLARGPGGFAEVPAHTETILVRGGEPVEVEVLETPRGPVIDGNLSLRVPARVDFDLGFGALLPLLRSRTVHDVAAALECWVEPVNSVLATDSTGAVLSLVAGRVPERDDECRRVPVPAWEPRYAWTGYAPMPRTSGTRFVNANDRRLGDTAELGVDFAPPHRANRIAALVEAGAAPEQVHFDARDPDDFLTRFEPRTPAGRELHARLVTWDRQMTADSADAGAYAQWRSTMVRKLADQPALRPLREPHGYDALFGPWLDPVARIGHALDRLFDAEVAADAMDEVAAGPPPGTWGSRHTLFPIAVLPTTTRIDETVPLSGDTNTVLCTAGIPGVTDVCWRGSVARYVWDVTDRSRSRWIVPFGASGNPDSPHFADQLPLWSRGELIPLVTDWSSLTPDQP